MINFNYSIQLPHINGGYIGIFDVHNQESPYRYGERDRLGKKWFFRYCQSILVDFQRARMNHRWFEVKFGKKYYKMMINKMKNGHTYPLKND
jgi:hypothetical protein